MTSKESRSSTSLLELNGETRPPLGATLLDEAYFLDALGAAVGGSLVALFGAGAFVAGSPPR